MANFNKSFQDEVRRLARKEAKDDLSRLRKDNAEMKHAIAQLRRRTSKLEQEKKQLSKAVSKVQPQPDKDTESGAQRARISGKTVRTMRARTGLTQAEFAELVGVSGQSVYQWERRDGQLQLRSAAKQAVVALKGVGAREAKQLLAAKSEGAAKKKPGRKRKAKAKTKAKTKAKARAKRHARK